MGQKDPKMPCFFFLKCLKLFTALYLRKKEKTPFFEKTAEYGLAFARFSFFRAFFYVVIKAFLNSF